MNWWNFRSKIQINKQEISLPDVPNITANKIWRAPYVWHRRRRFYPQHRSHSCAGFAALEYRGYDSCGVAVHSASLGKPKQGGLQRARSTARVSELMAQVKADHIEGGTGIAHTRWATHGAPAVHNAHPHFSHGTGAGAGCTQGDQAKARARGLGAQRHHRKPRRAARSIASQGL